MWPQNSWSDLKWSYVNLGSKQRMPHTDNHNTLRGHPIFSMFSQSLKDAYYAWGKYSTSGYFGRQLCYYTIFLKSDKNFLKRWFTSWITGQNVQKFLILQFFASYIARILKLRFPGPHKSILFFWRLQNSLCCIVSAQAVDLGYGPTLLKWSIHIHIYTTFACYQIFQIQILN